MGAAAGGIDRYFEETRRPIYSIAASAPFFIAYQLGIIYLLPRQPPGEQVRNRAEYILHVIGSLVGPHAAYALPVLAGMGLLYWLHRRERAEPRARGGAGAKPRPAGGFRTDYLALMYLEGLVLALPLAVLAFKVPQWLSLAGAPRAGLLFRLTTMCGAGAYEEVLFRLFLFTGLLAAGRRLLELEKLPAGILAAAVSAVLFAVFHPAGMPFGPEFRLEFFVFATLAGIYLAGICQARSFGAAVIAHAAYDILCVLAGK
jgi:hypothetical protein